MRTREHRSSRDLEGMAKGEGERRGEEGRGEEKREREEGGCARG